MFSTQVCLSRNVKHAGGSFVAILSKHIFMRKNEIKQFQLPWHSKWHGKAVTLTQSACYYELLAFCLSASASLFLGLFCFVSPHSTWNVLLFSHLGNSFLDFKSWVTSVKKDMILASYSSKCAHAVFLQH